MTDTTTSTGGSTPGRVVARNTIAFLRFDRQRDPYGLSGRVAVPTAGTVKIEDSVDPAAYTARLPKRFPIPVDLSSVVLSPAELRPLFRQTWLIFLAYLSENWLCCGVSTLRA